MGRLAIRPGANGSASEDKALTARQQPSCGGARERTWAPTDRHPRTRAHRLSGAPHGPSSRGDKRSLVPVNDGAYGNSQPGRKNGGK